MEQPPVPNPENVDWTMIKMSNIIKRDTLGRLYKFYNGRKIYLDSEEEFKQIVRFDSNCYSTGLKPKNIAECRNFIFECILQDNPTVKCMTDLRDNGEFFNVSIDEIIHMHPLLALKILQQFGFRKFLNRQLWAVESVESWLTTSGSQFVQFKNHPYFLSYLNKLVLFVNANPAILNKNLRTEENVFDRQIGEMDLLNRLWKTMNMSNTDPEKKT
jgi:hypothetical protein